MDTTPLQARARRVVTGFDESGRSTIVSDDGATARLDRPGGATVTEIWRADELPAHVGDLGPLTAAVVLAPPAAGLAVRVCTFPPDSAIDAETYASYAGSIAQSYGDDAASSKADGIPIPGMHCTETVDVVTVISGELHMVMENGETVLRAGDSLVQRRTPHAWSNRTGGTTTVVAIMMGASREPTR
jgi:mannose-6-phosphate isomerase-like protein (cupin superfamily)